MTNDQEVARKLAHAVSGDLSDKELDRIGQSAHRLVDQLATLTNDDMLIASRAAVMVATFCHTLLSMQVADLVETLDVTGAAYALAAGALSGSYELPPRREGPELPAPDALAEGTTEADIELDGNIGMYL